MSVMKNNILINHRWNKITRSGCRIISLDYQKTLKIYFRKYITIIKTLIDCHLHRCHHYRNSQRLNIVFVHSIRTKNSGMCIMYYVHVRLCMSACVCACESLCVRATGKYSYVISVLWFFFTKPAFSKLQWSKEVR